MNGYTERPDESLDALIERQTMYPRTDPQYVDEADLPRRAPRLRRCPDCGSIGGHTSANCPGND